MFNLFKKSEIIEKPRTVIIDNEIWFVGSDICRLLGTDTRDISKILDSNCFCYSMVETNGGKQKMIIIDKIGCSQLIANNRKLNTKQKNELLASLKLEGIGFGAKETEFMSSLKEVLDNAGIKIEFQKQVLSYRIDAYLPKYKLAIEFDEQYHNSQKEKDAIRQKAIQKELGCTFIRIPENNTTLKNIGLIIKEII